MSNMGKLWLVLNGQTFLTTSESSEVMHADVEWAITQLKSHITDSMCTAEQCQCFIFAVKFRKMIPY